MNEWAGFFLGVIAVAAVVQCAFVVMAARSLHTTRDRVTELCQSFDQELRPTLADLRAGASNLRAISDLSREQAVKVEALLSTTLEAVETTVEKIRDLVDTPISSLNGLSALWGGIRRGFETYRESTPRRRSPPEPARRSEDSDEHLFIG